MAIDLSKPVDVQLALFWDGLGTHLFRLLAITLPVYLAGMAGGWIAPPAGPIAAIGFAVSLGLGYLIMYGTDFAVSLTAFWTKSDYGVTDFKIALVEFMSGC